MYLHRCAVVLAFIAVLWSPPAARATLQYEETTKAIEVGGPGADNNTLLQNVRRLGHDADGKQTPGASADAPISWTKTLQRGPQGCQVKSVSVKLSLTVVQPAWSGRSRSPRQVQNYWDCLAHAAMAHERRHARIWHEAGQTLDSELGRIDDWMPCKQLDALLNETAQRVKAEAIARQAAFDRDDRRRPRYQHCLADLSKPVETADTHGAPQAGDDQGEQDGKQLADAAAQSSATDAGTEAAAMSDAAAKPRLGARLKIASTGVAVAAASSLWLLLWIGGFLVAGAASFVIVMKHRLSRDDADAVETFKERSALLRLARKVDASTGKHIARSSLPDRTGLRRRRIRPG